MKNIIKAIALSISLLSLPSCASVAGDNTRTVCVTSQPSGAGIYVDGQRRGTTPANITLSSYIYGGKSVVVKKEGYHEQVLTINSKFQPCGLWNILFWPGFLVDGATGNIVKIDPTQLNVSTDLHPVGQ